MVINNISLKFLNFPTKNFQDINKKERNCDKKGLLLRTYSKEFNRITLSFIKKLKEYPTFTSKISIKSISRLKLLNSSPIQIKKQKTKRKSEIIFFQRKIE